ISVTISIKNNFWFSQKSQRFANSITRIQSMKIRLCMIISFGCYFLLLVCIPLRAESLLEFQINCSNFLPNYAPAATSVFRDSDEEIWLVWNSMETAGADEEIFLRVLRNGKLSNQFKITDNSTADINPAITSYNNIVFIAYEFYNSVTDKFEILVVGERDGHSVQ